MNSRTFLVIAASLLTRISHAQTTLTWSGTDGVMNTAANWSPATVPLGTAQDQMLFNGSSTVNNLAFPGGTFSGNPGLGGLTVAAAQASALTITNSGAAASVFRLASNSSMNIESGAGAVTFGGTGATFFINLGNVAASVNTFTNNSSNLATISSNVSLNATGGGSGSQAAFGGTGDWAMAGNFTSSVSRGVLKNGTGRLTLSNTANAFAGGLTINGGIVRLGASEVITNSQTAAVNAAGILDLNGFNETINGITGTGIIQNEGAGTSTLTVGASNGTATFGGTLRNNSGAGIGIVALTKTGTGTLTLSGASTHTGLTTISGGTLAFAGNLPGAVTVQSGGTLNGEGSIGGNISFDGGSGLLIDATTAGALQAAGNLSLTGTVNVGFSKAPTSTAPFTILTYTGTLTGGAANLSISGGSSNYRTPTINDTVPNIITASVGSESRTWNGGTAWDINTSPNWLEGDNRFLQVDSVSFGDVGAGSIALTGVLIPASITVNSSADYTFTAAANNLIAGSGPLVKSGVGSLTLGGVNTFSGSITVNGGTLKPASSQALGANGKTITVSPGGALDTNGMLTVARDYAAVISGDGIGGTGAILNSGAAHNNGFTSITLAGDATIGGTNRWDVRPITAGTGLLNLAGFTLTKTGANTIAIVDSVISADGQIDINQGALSLSRNAVSGAGTINVNSTGILRFENNTSGTITKPINVNNGTINVLGTAFTVDSPVTVTNTGSIDAAINLTLTNTVSGNGLLTKLGAAAVILTGNATHSGGTTVSVGTLQIGNGGMTGSIAGDITNAGNVTFNRLDDITITNVISGMGSVTKLGAGTLSFSNPQTYTGATAISAGNILLAAANRLPVVTPVTLTNTAATNLNLNGFSQEIRSLAGGGALGGNVINAGTAATLTIRPTTTDGATFSGLIDGNIRLQVVGDKVAPSFVAPRQRLGNIANTFNGGTLVDGATLLARQDGSLGTIPLTFEPAHIILQNNGTLLNEADLNALNIHPNRGITLETGGGAFVAGFNQNVTINSVITGDAGNNITILGNNGTVVFTADNTYLGDTILGPVTANGTSRLRVGNGGLTGTLGGGNLSNDGQLTFDRNGNYAFAGAITGSGTLTTQGPGTVALNGVCTYTGATTISAGTLAINNTHGASAITVTAAGTLAGTGTISGTVTLDGTISPGNSVGKLTTTSLTEFHGGSKYVWEIGNWTGTVPGVDWDHFVTQEFTTTATASSKMIVAVNGTPAGFSESTKSFEIARSAVAFQPEILDAIAVDASAFAGAGNWSLRLADSNHALVLAYTSFNPGLYQTWIDSFPSITDPLKKTPTSDADADGLANMVEYVLNADPSNGSSTNRPTAQLSNNGENLVFVFTRLKEAASAGFTSSVECSETLLAGSWTTATSPMTAIQDNGTTEMLTVTIPIPPGADNYFARLVVTAP